MKTYVGIRHSPTHVQVWVLDECGGRLLDFAASRYLADIGERFDWGNDSRDAEQLAFAILNDHTGSPLVATDLSTEFMLTEVAHFDHTHWKLEAAKIDLWLSAHPVAA